MSDKNLILHDLQTQLKQAQTDFASIQEKVILLNGAIQGVNMVIEAESKIHDFPSDPTSIEVPLDMEVPVEDSKKNKK